MSGGGEKQTEDGLQYSYRPTAQSSWRSLAPIVVGRRNNPLFNPTSTLLPTRILPPTCTSPTAAQRWNPSYLNTDYLPPTNGQHGEPPHAQHLQMQHSPPQLHSHISLLPQSDPYPPPRHYLPHPQLHPPPPLHQPQVPVWDYPLPTLDRDRHPELPRNSYMSINSNQYDKPHTAADNDSTSSSSSDESFISCSEDEAKTKTQEPALALVPLKDSNPDAMYLDPATETCMPR